MVLVHIFLEFEGLKMPMFQGLHYNQSMRSRLTLSLLLILSMLAACNPAPAPAATDLSPLSTQTLAATAEMIVATPVQQQELRLPQAELQAQVRFPLLELTFLPDGLMKNDVVQVKTFADGSQTVEKTYRDPSTARDLVLDQSNIPLDSAEWLQRLAPAGANAGRREIQVRGCAGNFYASDSGEPGLLWQEGDLTYSLRLAGAGWPGQVSDDLLLWMAESLQAGEGTAYTIEHKKPSTWMTYSSATYQLSFAVPRDWEQTGDAMFSGENGFVRLETYKSYGASVDQACEIEANRHPERYGLQPEMRSIAQEWNNVNIASDPCLILPGEDAPDGAETVLILRDPSRPGKTAFLRLAVDPLYAELIAYSLVIPHAGKTTSTAAWSTPAPASIPADIEPQVIRMGPLTMERYPIVAASLDWPGHFEFAARIPAAVLARRAGLRGSDGSQNPTGATSAGRAITLEEDSSSTTHIDAVVRVDGQEVYRYTMLQHAGSSKIYGVWNWAGRWVLEVNGALVVEGELYNEMAGYQEIFNFRMLNGKPFFFFVKDGQTGIFYDGAAWQAEFDSIYHGACCEPAIANPASNNVMVWFYAKQQDWWNYVELGIFN
jgi:hypothetical protein